MFLHGIHPLRAVPRTRQERSAFFFDKTIIGIVRFENAIRLSFDAIQETSSFYNGVMISP